MDASTTQEPVAKATLLQKMKLSSVVSKIKTWKKRFGDRKSRSSSKAVKPSVTPQDHPISSPDSVPAPAQETATTTTAHEMAVGDAVWAGDDQEEPKIKIILQSQAQIERLRAVTKRFNLPMLPVEYISTCDPAKERPRVQKTTRVRVRRTCHRCDTVFPGSRVCPGCEHRLCGLCHRHPRHKAPEPAPIAVDTSVADQEEDYQAIKDQIAAARAARVPSQPLVRKAIRQRVRRTCHSCSTLFTHKNKICTNCQHACCTDCPRSPPKRAKYPNGYPGDQPASSSTAPPARAGPGPSNPMVESAEAQLATLQL